MSNSTFINSTFNPTTDHNARFAKKNLQLNVNTFDAMLSYIENGGTITVCKPGRRSKSNTSFPAIRGTVAHSGHQSVALRRSGKLATKKG